MNWHIFVTLAFLKYNIRDHRGKSKLFTKQTTHNHKFLGSCELKAPLGLHIGRMSSQRLDQASVDIMENSQHVNHVSQYANRHVIGIVQYK